MNFIDISIKKPVSVFVGIVLILMFGMVALTQLPYKLTPNVIEPEIGVVTLWPGATPSEVERFKIYIFFQPRPFTWRHRNVFGLCSSQTSLNFDIT